MKIEKIHPLIVAGAGELGIEVTKGLLAHGEQVVLIDRNEQRIQRARDRGYKAFLGAIEDPTPDIIEALENAQALVSTHADTEYSYRICSEARSTYGIDHVIAQVSSPNDLPLFEQIGVATMNAALDRSALLVLLTRNPAMYQLLTRTDDDKEVMEVVVHNPGCVGKLLREIHLPGDALVMALRRNGDLLVPHGNTRIEFNDHLTLVGSLDCMDEVRYLFGYDDQPAEIVPANGAGVDL